MFQYLQGGPTGPRVPTDHKGLRGSKGPREQVSQVHQVLRHLHIIHPFCIVFKNHGPHRSQLILSDILLIQGVYFIMML